MAICKRVEGEWKKMKMRHVWWWCVGVGLRNKFLDFEAIRNTTEGERQGEREAENEGEREKETERQRPIDRQTNGEALGSTNCLGFVSLHIAVTDYR